MNTDTALTAPTRVVEAAGIRFAYRRFGDRRGGVPIAPPLIFFMHFTGTMDHWDPALTDGFAQDREVILFDNAGVSSSSGDVPTSVEEMAQHAAAFIDALGIKKVDALGFSIGGTIAQQLTIDRPDLVRKLILVGTGPRSGEGMASFTPEAQEIFGAKYDPPDELWLRVFFTPSEPSQAAGRKYLERQRARKENRDPLPNERVAPAQAAALQKWGAPTKDPYAVPDEDHSAHSRGERQQRRARVYGQLIHSPAESPERAVDPLSRRESRITVSISRALCCTRDSLPERVTRYRVS